MKTCVQCGAQFGPRKREGAGLFAKRRFCSRACADAGRPVTPRLPNEQFKARYRQIKVNGRKYLEHRWVMEQHIGRPLLSTEQVHHINHDRLDNRIENLELVTVAEHAQRHTWRPVTSDCVVCGATFTPHKTKRARKQTCSPACKSQLLSIRNAERKERAA